VSFWGEVSKAKTARLSNVLLVLPGASLERVDAPNQNGGRIVVETVAGFS